MIEDDVVSSSQHSQAHFWSLRIPENPHGQMAQNPSDRYLRQHSGSASYAHLRTCAFFVCFFPSRVLLIHWSIVCDLGMLHALEHMPMLIVNKLLNFLHHLPTWQKASKNILWLSLLYNCVYLSCNFKLVYIHIYTCLIHNILFTLCTVCFIWWNLPNLLPWEAVAIWRSLAGVSEGQAGAFR